MSYQVLARKYRPQRFEEVVGQIHVTQTLQNALQMKRLHHAYLFTGARGVGKTTVARILAKALNCEKGPGREPCNVCPPCTEVLEGKSLDVLEIDGASNTGVDDVRQIREQVKYLPAQGKYKVYIIDEVHMLSTSAFNALLKTLEEPPPHVIFVFATTEPHKIPATILSRCQRFDFRRIPSAEIAAALQEIAAAEKVTLSKEALSVIAHEAAGSLRDAQSLLDQAIAFAGADIGDAALQSMLGFTDKTQLRRLLTAVLKKNREAALAELNAFYQTGFDLNRLGLDLLMSLRQLLLIGSLREVPDWLDLPKEELEALKKMAGESTLEELDSLFQLAYRGVEEIARSAFPKMVFEVLLVRMTQLPRLSRVAEILEKLERGEVAAPAATPKISSTAATAPISAPAASAPAPGKNWDDFLGWLAKEKPQLASIMNHGQLVALGDTLVTLGFESGSMYGEMLQEEDRRKQFQTLFSKFFGRELALKIITAQTAVRPAQELAQESAQRRKNLKDEALRHESVKEAANILGAVVEEVRVPESERRDE